MTLTVVPLRRVFRVVSGGTPTSHPENWGGDIAWATPVDLAKCNGGKLSSTQRSLTAAGLVSGSIVVPEASLIVSSRAPIGYVAETTRSMAFNQGCRGLVPMQEVDIRFFRYQLSSMVAQLQSCGQGSTFLELSADALASSPIAVPSPSTQQMIADYLDAETARIDALISRKRQLIRLLEERKSLLAEATLAVLRTSEPSVPLKYLVYESDLRHGSDSDPTVLSVSIHQGVTPKSTLPDGQSRADDLSRHKKCSIGDIVINRMRAFQGAVGVVGRAGVVSPDYTVLQIGSRVSPNFLHYVMRSSWFVSEMTRRLRGIGTTDQGQVRTPRINFADLGLIEVPVPPKKKQDDLCFDLANQETSLTQAVDLQTKQIALLAERRQALITATVTGEMQVPKATAA